jgi:hypothetical protein
MDAPSRTLRVRIERGARASERALVAVALLTALAIGGLVGRATAGDAQSESGSAVSLVVPESGPQGHIGDMAVGAHR